MSVWDSRECAFPFAACDIAKRSNGLPGAGELNIRDASSDSGFEPGAKVAGSLPAVIAFDSQSREVVDASEGAEALFPGGYQSLKGLHVGQLIGDEGMALLELCAQDAKQGSLRCSRFRTTLADGSETTAVIVGGNGPCTLTLLPPHPFVESQAPSSIAQAQLDLVQAREQLAFASDLARIGYWEYDYNTSTYHFDAALCRLLHIDSKSRTFSRREVIDMLSAPEELQSRLAHAYSLPEMAIEAGGNTVSTELVSQRADGTRITLTQRFMAHYDAAGNPLRVVGVAKDVTEAREQERLLRESEARLQSHLEATPLAIIGFDAELRITEWSRGAEQMFGWTAAEVVGKAVGSGPNEFPLVALEDLQALKEDFQRTVADGQSAWLTEGKNLRKDGNAIVCRWHTTIQRDSDGKFASILSIAEDITERVQDQCALAESLALYKAIFNKTSQGIVVTNVLGIIQSANHMVASMFGYTSPDELIGRNISVLVPLTHSSRHDEYINEFLHGKRSRIIGVGRDVPGRTRQGEEKPFHVVVQRLVVGGETQFVALVRDLSRERTLERQLQRSQRLEALGTLAGGIAHDFNNILSPVVAQIGLGLRDKSNSAATLKRFERLQVATERARGVIANLLRFTKAESLEKAPLQLADLAREVFEMMREALPGNVDLRFHAEAGLPRVYGDQTQLHQVLVNLVTNAYQALEAGNGVVNLRVGRPGSMAIGETELGELASDECVAIEIEDNGPGIPRDLRERIFNPFFTTKRERGGSGLGLSLVHQIIHAHHGQVILRDTPGGGATFLLILPAGSHVPAAGEAGSGGDGERDFAGRNVLVVDDEPEVSKAMLDMLGECGATARCFNNPVQALQELQTSDLHSFDLALIDHAMPQMLGTSLAEELAKRDPDLPVIMLSGNVLAVDTNKVQFLKQVLQKPIGLDELEALLASMPKRVG